MGSVAPDVSVFSCWEDNSAQNTSLLEMFWFNENLASVSWCEVNVHGNVENPRMLRNT